MQNWGKGMVAPNGIIDQRLKAVKFQEPPYIPPTRSWLIIGQKILLTLMATS